MPTSVSVTPTVRSTPIPVQDAAVPASPQPQSYYGRIEELSRLIRRTTEDGQLTQMSNDFRAEWAGMQTTLELLEIAGQHNTYRYQLLKLQSNTISNMQAAAQVKVEMRRKGQMSPEPSEEFLTRARLHADDYRMLYAEYQKKR